MRTGMHASEAAPAPLPGPNVPVDVSAVGHTRVRETVRAAVGDLGYSCSESDFWTVAFGLGRTRSQRRGTLVVGDLFHFATRFLARPAYQWTAAVRRNRPYFLALVRTRRDERYAWLVDDLLRSSDLRFTVCRAGPRRPRMRECLAGAIAALEPDTLLDVRLSPDQRRLRVEFADGLSGALEWERLGIGEALQRRLVLESATVGRGGRTVQLSRDGEDLFEIDAAAIRALLDREFAGGIEAVARRSGLTVGERVRDARRAAGLTQTALADRTGLDQAVISRLERGKHRPRLDTLARVARGLGLSVARLLSA